MGMAIEVHDIGTDRVLATELRTVESAITKQSLEDALGDCGVAPQFSRPGFHVFGCGLRIFALSHLG
jgi:hypothetical protein